MRQVLSWRLVAALAALVGLAFFVNVAFAGRGTVAELATPSGPTTRRADLISLVFEIEQNGFSMPPSGLSEGELILTLPSEQTVRIFPGTPGVVNCANLDQFGQCAVLAEVLGDAVVWFALVPMGPSFTFELPAIVALDGGYARLVNGWQVPYAPVIDRSDCESPAESFSEFLRLQGTEFRSIYDLGPGAITTVEC